MIRWFKKLWNGETDGLSAAAFVVGAASLASRLIGVLRDRVLASTFGAGDALDAYYAAFRLPDLLYTLVIFGALTAGFIPVFSEYLERRGEKDAMRLAGQVVSLVAIVMALACAGFILATPQLVPWMTPGYTGEKLQLTIDLSRIIFLSPILLGLSAVYGGVLQSMRRFFAFALAPVLYNLGIIAGAIFLTPSMGVHGVAWGVVLGAMLHFLAQVSVAVPLGLVRIPLPSFRSEGVRRIVKLMIPRTASLAATQVMLVVLLSLASTLESGAVAVFNLAQNLLMFPVGIVGISYAIAAFPEMARAWSGNRSADFRSVLVGAARKIFYFMLPITALYVLLRAQFVRLALGAGVFDWSDTIRTADLLGWLALALVAHALVPLLIRAFFATQDSWTPFWISIGVAGFHTVLAVLWSASYGLNGLGAAATVAAFVQLLLLWLTLRWRRGGMPYREMLSSGLKTFIATAALAAVAYPLRQWLGTVYPLRTFWQVVLQTFVSMGGGLAAFLLASWVLRSEEFIELRNAIAGRLWRRATVKESVDQASGMA